MRWWEWFVLLILLLALTAALSLVTGVAEGAPAPPPRREASERWLDGWPRVYRAADGGSSVTLHQGGRIEFESVPGQTMHGTWLPAGEGVEWDACAWGPGWHLRWRSRFDSVTPAAVTAADGKVYKRLKK